MIRHASSLWTHGLLRRAESEGLDVETYVPPSKVGLKTALLLSEYITGSLGKQLEGAVIYSSPIFRARFLANVVLAEIVAQEKPAFPDDVLPCQYLAEMPWKDSVEEAYAIIERAKAEGTHFLWLEIDDNPEGNVERFNLYLRKAVLPALEFLDGVTNTLTLAFSHSGTIGLLLWAIDQIGKGKQNLSVSQEDLQSIAAYMVRIPPTSISEIWKQDDRWIIGAVGQTPHLDSVAKEDLLW